eukprot:Nitzschia sp. Nitz4//scaffold331_size19140//10591//13853//NITZ4_008734-RA/size19140-processed-gene-0.38-mRNA-1//-1//CDS//3329548182//5584//frame0
MCLDIIVGVGFLLFLSSSAALMLLFWPEATGFHGAADTEAELLEPLLAANSHELTDTEHLDAETSDTIPVPDLDHPSENSATLSASNDGANYEDESPVPAEPMSRIRGTRRLLKLVAPEVSFLYIGCITLLIRLPFSLAIPHFVSTTLGSLAADSPEQGFWVFLDPSSLHKARREIMWIFVLGTVDACLDFWCIFWFGYANQRIVRGVRLDTFSAILRQDIAYFDQHTSGSLASRLNSDCGEMAGVVRITGITTYMLIRSPPLAACALCIVPVVATVNKLYGNWLNKNAQLVQDALADANSVAQETFACVRTVIAFATESVQYMQYREKIDCQYNLNVKQTYMTGIYYMFISTFLINTVVQGTLLLVGSYMIQRGSLTGQILLAFMLYQGQLQNEMMNLFQSYSSLIKSSGAGDKVFELLDRSPPPPATGNAQVQCFDGQLVPRLNDDKTERGRILLNGCDIRTLDIQAMRRHIGIVTQDPILFSGTIRSNIAYGVASSDQTDTEEVDVPMDTIIAAAKKANAHDFISAFPDGYETKVGERGVQLSGGQKQRLAISRAIIRNPSILILDEATSALDPESEEVTQAALDHLLDSQEGPGRISTVVIIAHRLRTVRNADMIAVIDKGQVAELGSHDTLMKSENRSYNRWNPKPSFGNKTIKEHWDVNKTPAMNLAAMGLVGLPNDDIHRANDRVKSEEGTAIQLFDIPESDSLAKKKRHPMSADDQKYIVKCMSKYGEDYSKMFRDIKLNNMQHTEAQLRKMGARYLLLSPDERVVELKQSS